MGDGQRGPADALARWSRDKKKQVWSIRELENLSASIPPVVLLYRIVIHTVSRSEPPGKGGPM
jgi:hypothetical protein